MTSTLDHALNYLRRGWSVFPLQPGLKKPPKGWSWKPYQSRLPTEAEVIQWFTNNPDANIAIITGRISGIVVVDIDPGHGGTTDDTTPTDCVAQTGRGGVHLFYTYPEDGNAHPNRQGGKDGFPVGVDVRGDGGYVVAAPSDTSAEPDGGGPYRWQQFSDAGELPDWIRTWDSQEAKDDNEGPKEPWLNDLLKNGAPNGQRNASMIRMAGYYAKLGLPFDATVTLVRQWADVQDGPVISRREVETTVRSAFKMERKRNRPAKVADIEVANGVLPVTRLEDYMLKHGGNQTKWTIRDWLPDATIAFLVSPPQSYKTYLSFDLAVSVASGEAFLGQFPVTNPGPVIIFQQEDPASNIAERIAMISTSRLSRGSLEIWTDDAGEVQYAIPIIEDGELPIYFHEERKLRFDNDEIMDALEGLVASIKPRLVIIDPLYSAADTEDYMAKAAQQMLRLKDLRDRYGTTFIIAHHTNKAMDTWDRQRVWGSQFINAFIETSYLMRKPPLENSTVVLRHFKVAGQQPFVRCTFNIQDVDPPFTYQVVTEEITLEEADRVMKATSPNAGKSGWSSDKPNKVEDRILEALAERGPLTVDQLSNALDVSTESVDKSVRALLHKHRISQDAAGRWSTLDVDK